MFGTIILDAYEECESNKLANSIEEICKEKGIELYQMDLIPEKQILTTVRVLD